MFLFRNTNDPYLKEFVSHSRPFIENMVIYQEHAEIYFNFKHKVFSLKG